MADSSKRGQALTVFAILFGLLAVSNILKPMQFSADQGFVFFGTRLTGFWNAVLGPLFGVFLLTYAYGIWNMKRFAMAMGHAYATYVIINLIAFSMSNPSPQSMGEKVFIAVYAIVAIGVSVASAAILTKRKDELS
jgi:hypothetical protein